MIFELIFLGYFLLRLIHHAYFEESHVFWRDPKNISVLVTIIVSKPSCGEGGLRGPRVFHVEAGSSCILRGNTRFLERSEKYLRTSHYCCKSTIYGCQEWNRIDQSRCYQGLPSSCITKTCET